MTGFRLMLGDISNSYPPHRVWAIALQVAFAITMPSWLHLWCTIVPSRLRSHLCYIMVLLCLWLSTKRAELISIFPWQLFLAALWQFVPTYTFCISVTVSQCNTSVTPAAIWMSHLFISHIFYNRLLSHRLTSSFWKKRRSTNTNCRIFHFFASL